MSQRLRRDSASNNHWGCVPSAPTPPLANAAIGTGIAVDKMLALTGQASTLQIVNIPLPTPPEERAERSKVHAVLDAIAAKLKASE
jgi:hypothetical protein